MKLFGRELIGFAKALVILVAILLVSSGLCGLQWLVSMGTQRDSGIVMIPLGVVELLAMLVSALGIVLVLLVWGAWSLLRQSPTELKIDGEERSSDDPQTKPDEEQ